MTRKVGIIGSGFSSLSAACHLAKSGYNVTVLEKNSGPGGRAQQLKSAGFTFDMGPSWYWMPNVFEHFFSQFDKTPSDFYKLHRLDPSYRVKFKDEFVDIPAELQQMYELFERIEPGSSGKLKVFLKQAEYKYEVGINKLVYKPSRSLLEFVDPTLLVGLFRMDVFTSISTHIRKFFKNEKLIQLMEFPVLFLGSTAESTPALYSLMNYADIKLGTWYPETGMYAVVKGMETLAKDLGVNFYYDQPVTDVVIKGKSIEKLITTGNEYPVDVVVAGADYHHIDQQLLPEDFRSYSAKYWDSRTMAPSSLLFYIGLDTKLHNMQHHVLFFDEDFKQHASEIYIDPQWPKKPLLYASVTSMTDATVAPKNHENLVVLIPVAPDLEDTEEIRERYFHLICKRLSDFTGVDIQSHIVFRKSFAHKDFISNYHSFKGNAYGLANTLMQTAILRPSLKNKKVRNLFHAGQLTVPGPGVPPAIISGEVVSREIAKEFS
ncbi:MAG: phytoene desaturase family protein [Bacteroidota bacterium]